mgnify:CR=1 FL=1
MMEAFGIDTGGASEFIMLNSASRYVAIGIGMIVGIWVFKTYHSILIVLLIRLSMDVLDLVSGCGNSRFYRGGTVYYYVHRAQPLCDLHTEEVQRIDMYSAFAHCVP